MGLFRKLLIFATLWACPYLIALHASAEEVHTLVTDPYPPYAMISGNDPSGIVVDIVTEAFRRAERPLNIEIMPWKRALALTKAGRTDGIFTLFYTEERTQHFVYSQEFLGYADLVFMARKGTEIRFSGDIKSIQGQRIAVPAGYNAGPRMEDIFKAGKAIKVDVPNLSLGLKMLLAGRINLIFDNRYVLLNLAKDYGVLEQVSVLNPAINSTPYHIGYSKRLTSSTALRDAIDVTLRQMWKDGSIQRIYAKYSQ